MLAASRAGHGGATEGPVLQVKSGVVYEGIFHTADLEKDLSIVLKMAKVVKDPAVAEGTWVAASKPVPSLVV